MNKNASIDIPEGMIIVRIRRISGYAGGSNYYHHADIICRSVAEALLAAKEKRVQNWRMIDIFDTSNKDYSEYISLGKISADGAKMPHRPTSRLDLSSLKDTLAKAWCAETAYGDWSPQCPSLNQCLVTSLVVQDYLGGQVLCRKMTDGNIHYLNRLPDNSEVDLTDAQLDYLGAQPIKAKTTVYNRKRLLRFKTVIKRYLLLKTRIEEIHNNLPFSNPRL
jgi:hypothetical protein